MTREELIIAEAKKYYSGNIQCYDAFLHGVQFAEEHPINVWHQVTDVPEKAGLIVYRDINGRCDSVYVGDWDVEFWLWCIGLYKIYKWAYITDLCPKGD